MPVLALKMFLGASARFYGMLLGLAFPTLLTSKRASIFVGIMTRTLRLITDTTQPGRGIVDPEQQWLDDNKPQRATTLQRVGTRGGSPGDASRATRRRTRAMKNPSSGGRRRRAWRSSLGSD
jgi:hypothetical protein